MDAYGHGLGKIEILPLYPIDDHEDAAFGLYKRINRRDLERIFWWQQEPVTFRSFLEYFAKRRLLLALYDHEGEFLGVAWIEGMVGKQKCELGAWATFSARGLNAVELMKEVLDFAHGKLGFRSVFCHTPWKTAFALCRRAGLHTVAIIGDYPLKDFDTTLYIMRSDRDREL